MADRRVWCVLLLVLSLLFGNLRLDHISASQDTYPNNLPNGNFENGKQEWRVRPLDGSFGVVEREDGQGLAAALWAPASTSVEIFQPISIEPGSEYRLSGETLWTDSGYEYVLMRASFKGADGKTRQVREFHASAGHNDWQDLGSEWLAPPADAKWLEVALSVTASTSTPEGPVLFDNILLEHKVPPIPTPEPTATPSPPAEIYVNEVLSRPATDWNRDGATNQGDEWIELHNAGDVDVDLDEWVLDDGPGGSDPFMLRSMFIHAGGYFVLFSSATGLRLNDSGETVRLYRSDGALADEIQVPPLDADQSVGRYPDGNSTLSTKWLPTPGQANGARGETPEPTPEPTNTPVPTATPKPTQTPVPTATPEPTSTPVPTPPLLSIAEARQEHPGKTVRVRGTVTSPAHLVGARRLYVQDETGGMLVVVPEEQQGPGVGTRVEATGTTGTYYGERALRDGRDIVVLGSPSPASLTDLRTGQIGAQIEGALVRVSGSVAQVNKPSIRVDDGSGESRVRVAESTGIEWPSPRKYDELEAIGIVSSFNGSYRVLPRFASDLKLIRNVPEQPQPRVGTVRQARTAADGSLLQIKGFVTAPPGPLGESRFWVQDETGGILITGWRDAPVLAPGSRVRVTGEAGDAYGERRLQASSNGVERLDGSVNPEPAPIRLSHVGPESEGLFVEIQGAVAGSVWPSIYLGSTATANQAGVIGTRSFLASAELEQAQGTVRVYARKSAYLNNPRAKQGDVLRAIGIVSSYQGAYRLLPWEQRHLEVIRRGDSHRDYTPATIAQARSAPEGNTLLIQGTVTAPSNLLGDGLMYLQDNTAGILVTGAPPGIGLGDIVRLKGESGTYYSERRLIADHTSVIGDTNPPNPLKISSSEVGPSTEGLLVSLQGRVASSSWPTIYVGEPTARTRARASTGIANPQARQGDRATVTGIVSRRGDRYSVLPRYLNDLLIHHAAPSTSQGGRATPGAAVRGWHQVVLSETRELPLGTRVLVEGRVTAPPGVLGAERMYIGDEQAGIALHLVHGGYPALSEGDKVEVRGEVDTYHGERIVRLTSAAHVARLGHGPSVRPVVIGTHAVSEQMEGRLVAVQARITGRQWPTLYLNDGSGQARTRVLDSTSIPRLEGGKNDLAAITGIVSQWDGRWRLLPRWRQDIQISVVPRIPLTGAGGLSAVPPAKAAEHVVSRGGGPCAATFSGYPLSSICRAPRPYIDTWERSSNYASGPGIPPSSSSGQ